MKKMTVDTEMKSPNSIAGRDGSLLQVTNWLNDSGPYWRSEPNGPKRGDLVMLVASGKLDDDYGWIEVLHAEKVWKLNVHPKYWMNYFMPWPRGGFIGT